MQIKLDLETEDGAEIADTNYNIVAWGAPDSSKLVQAAMADAPKHEPAHQTVAMIRPNPHNPKRYLLINSGPTFREAHDRTNSLQNPKLGDWAIIDLRSDPNAEAPGKIVSSGFFDEEWRCPPPTPSRNTPHSGSCRPPFWRSAKSRQ
jgi:hypothetical protein